MALTTTLEEQKKNNTVIRQNQQSAGDAGNASLYQQTAQNAQAQQQAGYNLRGVSAGTQAGLSQYGQKYAPSQTVADAQAYLQSKMEGKPGDYESQYSGAIADLYDQIMNRPKFSYDVNKDPLFQQYKNQYVTQGQRAMQDTMGQAAALTGGYGNSWGSTAGYQAYQAYLQMLNSAIPELEQRAYDRYQAEGDELRNNMQMNLTLDDMGYGRYRDTVADWQTDRNFANQLYSQERGWDMSDWERLQNYFQTMAQLENSDYWEAENFAEKQRQFNETMAYNYYNTNLDEAFRQQQAAEAARQYDQDYEYKQYMDALDEAYRRDQLAQNQGQYDSDLAFKQAQLAQNQNQWAAEQALAQAKFDFQLRQYEEAMAAAQGGGSGGGSGSGSGSGAGNASAQTATSTPLTDALKARVAANSSGTTASNPLVTAWSNFVNGLTKGQDSTPEKPTIVNTTGKNEANQRQDELRRLAGINENGYTIEQENELSTILGKKKKETK